MKSKRTVGIITMHRPVSFGSSLQAYALQRKIESMGYDCEIIDYKYPNRLHYGQKPLSRRMTQFVRFMLNLPLGFPNVIEKIRFSLFRKRYLKLSSHYYDTAEKLCVAPPEYDVYCTGSDQVWNSLFTKSDTSFLLSFVPENRRKVSYASSFAVDYIKAGYEQTYKKYLSEYSHISVRESSGIRIIKELLDRSAQLVCDPTILLTKEEWYPLVTKSKIKITEPYILVFMLTYSFDPYPEVDRIIDTVHKKFGYRMVFLSGRKQDYLRKGATVIKSAGPCEFLELIWNASFVITSSFHGVAFSVNFGKDFIAIVKNGNSDSRLMSFLQKIHMEDRAVPFDSLAELPLASIDSQSALKEFRDFSTDYLETILN